MALLNYSTTIEASKTASEIQLILSTHGTRAILTNYSNDGEVESLSFQVITPSGEIGIRLPVDPGAVLKVLDRQSKQGKVPRRFVTRSQANKIAWRILKDWVAAQMAILETEMVRMEQIFLPYVVTPTGQTVYEVIAENKFLLTEGGE